MKENRRRTYLIDREFQLRFIFLFLSAVAAVALLTGFLSYFMLSAEIERHLYSPHISFDGTGAILRPLETWINLGLALALTAVTCGMAIWYMRKTAGSLARFSAHLSLFKTGKIPGEIHFRKNDPLHEVAEDFNRMSDSLSSSRRDLRASLDAAVFLLDKLSSYENRADVAPCELLDQACREMGRALEHADFTSAPGEGPGRGS